MWRVFRISIRYFLYTMQANFRQAQYGVQFLLFPTLALSLFLATYFVIRMIGQSPQILFYPFITYLIANYTLGVTMQITFRFFSNPADVDPFLITPSGLNTFLGCMLAYAWETIIGFILTLVVAFLMTRPAFYFPESIFGFALVGACLIPLIWIGMGIGMKFMFSHELSQIVMISFFALLLVKEPTPFFSTIMPLSAAIALMQAKGTMHILLFGGVGTALWWLTGRLFLHWAYTQYRLGKGVNRK